MDKIEFLFLPERKLFRTKSYKAKNVSEWFDHCLAKGMLDIKTLMPSKVRNRKILGFSNTTESSLVCFFESNVTFFAPFWDFDISKKMWNVLYTEQVWEYAPEGRPHYKNNTDDFKFILRQIEALAREIDCDYFADIFKKAHSILSGSPEHPESDYPLPLPQIPPEHLNLFRAASTADVFGAMGSWNDNPLSYASEKGLGDDYEALSKELLKQIRSALIFSINEW